MRKRVIFFLLMIILSPLVVLFITSICVLALFVFPFERIIFNKKYQYLGKYYVYKLYIEKLIIKTYNKLNELNIKFTYDSNLRIFTVNNTIIRFNISDNKNIDTKNINRIVRIKTIDDVNNLQNMIII